ncbi:MULTISPECIES: hypothetical protein [Sphingobacterium]|uniref:hypothetical protein n=1 Tax=Sphingobacterium TaxID=28453 RepID=UPI002580DA16|nr:MULTISPECIES: hypothetical protein [Sphingobacterium]
MVRNLKYIKNIIEEYFALHPMVNDVKFGDSDKLSTYKKLKYPLLNFEYVKSNFNAGNDNATIWEFAIMDLSDEITEFDVIDATNEIAQDFLKFLENHNDLEINGNVSVVPFSDNFGDLCSGNVFTVTFSSFRNNCLNILPL